MKTFLLFVLCLTLQAQGAIYGQDDLVPIFRAPSAIKALSPSVGIMFSPIFLKKDAENSYSLEVHPLNDSVELCPTEPWQNYEGFYVSCSGFLVAPDLMITAGHCMVNFGEATHVNSSQCQGFVWVFDFNFNGDMSVQKHGITQDQIAECAEVIKAVHNSSTDPHTGKITFREDYALIRLKHPVNRPYLKFANASYAPGTKVGILGHPLGTGMMYGTGKILSSEDGYYRTNLDAFPGHSGAPVINEAGQVLGLLVRGYPETLIDGPNPSCYIVNHCDEDARTCTQNDSIEKTGEHVQMFDDQLLQKLLQ